MDDFINKEIDAYWNEHDGTHFYKDELKKDELKDVANKIYKKGYKRGKLEATASIKVFEKTRKNIQAQARTDLIAELVGKVREERVKERKGLNLSNMDQSGSADLGWICALDRAVEIINNTI